MISCAQRPHFNHILLMRRKWGLYSYPVLRLLIFGWAEGYSVIYVQAQRDGDFLT